MQLSSKAPEWYADFYRSFTYSEAHCFILHGDIMGIAYERMYHHTFLEAMLSKQERIVICYDRARGIRFSIPTQKEVAMRLYKEGGGKKRNTDATNAALAGLIGEGAASDAEPFSAKQPLDALTTLETLLRSKPGKNRIAVLVDFADSIFPPTEKTMMSPNASTLLVLMQTLANDPKFMEQRNPIFLLTRSLTDIHPDLRSRSSGFKSIEIALPDKAARLAYLQWYSTLPHVNKPKQQVNQQQTINDEIQPSQSLTRTVSRPQMHPPLQENTPDRDRVHDLLGQLGTLGRERFYEQADTLAGVSQPQRQWRQREKGWQDAEEEGQTAASPHQPPQSASSAQARKEIPDERTGSPVVLKDVTLEELAQLTAGLNLRHLEDIILYGAKEGGITKLLIKARKDQIISTEYTEIAEMLEPLAEGFRALGGVGRIISWAKNEIITPVISGKGINAPKGVFLVGPPGTGKTFFVRALCKEIGFNAVMLNLANILGGIVGESERNLKKFFTFARALAPVLIFIDELDQTDISRRGTGSGNPVAANLFNSMLQFMSDETLRGRVIVVFASNRPDLIDPALLRFGRVDAILPILLPDEKARYEITQAQARTQGCQMQPDICLHIAESTDKYSAADIAAIVAKARKLALRAGHDITRKEAEAALTFIQPNTPDIAEWYTLLAIQACNDTELLPQEYIALKKNRSLLQQKISQSQSF